MKRLREEGLIGEIGVTNFDAAHLDLALEWVARARPKRAILTNMHIDLDYATVAAETPDHVTPAHDGLVLTLPV